MAERRDLGEFGIIGAYFEPLSRKEPGAGRLLDDAAVLKTRPGHELVVTMDTLIAGVHFTEFSPPRFVAAKALGANLSDLAAMGAEAAFYTLSLSLPKDDETAYGEAWIEEFAGGLAEEQERYGVVLVGGDTVATPGPLSVTLTAFGWCAEGRALNRSGAAPGDDVYVSGSIGDAWLGLSVVRGGYPDLPPHSVEYLTDRYHRPRPRLDLGRRLAGLASAAMDVSDGLVQDLGHICRASGVGAEIDAADVPLSAVAGALCDRDPHLLAGLLAGGDDYELLFTAPPEHGAAIGELGRELDLRLTRIGGIVEAPDGGGVNVKGVDDMQTTGYRHF